MGAVSALSSVHRALQVLEVVAAAGDGISAKAVARRLEYNLSTTYHLLESLVTDGYLVRLEASRGFGLGPKLPALHDRLVAQLPVPRGLGGILGEVHSTAQAGALYAAFRDGDVVVVAHDDCADHPVPVISAWRGALHATAIGKLLLAEADEVTRRAILDRDGLPAHAYRTMTERDALERELTGVRRNDLAVDRGEFRERLACMAAPGADVRGRGPDPRRGRRRGRARRPGRWAGQHRRPPEPPRARDPRGGPAPHRRPAGSCFHWMGRRGSGGRPSRITCRA